MQIKHLRKTSVPFKCIETQIYSHLISREAVRVSRLHKTEDDQCISVWLLFFQLPDKKFSSEKVLQKYDGSSPS